ncbi:putative GNAT family N-acyltransferase [Murinocardiopsis flavida]|uniref:Putative GNAT family N-acyltransferase n=1 Tax=Murinocardiopsis flavida TaxID=645275 RepID=A0A2P8D3N5_9ACTN|nr:GNAT family N-acetyltransferase [Murinocardiopsis flavida]PSK91824.1 putative GNAT family N-acyltransferase [Murinocardiopsis flavida]
MLNVSLATGNADLFPAFAIRGAVFIAEQAVPAEMESDTDDLTADHFLARLDGAPVGTGRLVVHGAEAHLGRLAVLPQARGARVGVALVAAIERRAAERGLSAVDLNAQSDAIGFYEKLGYAAFGPEFMDAGIPHQAMRKVLPQAAEE